MALHATGRGRIVVDGGVNPVYRKMLYSYTANLSIDFCEIPVTRGQSDRKHIFEALDANTAAVIIQNPNFFGVVDNHGDISKICHARGALVVESVYPISLGLLATPAEMGADIATGEGQSLGIPLSFGGPYLGFMACRKDFVRQFPGRIAGETKDTEGKRGFVVTLSTREQHIRREKATSNICTNEAWCALRATIFLETLGRKGIQELAYQNVQKAAYALNQLTEIKGVRRKFGGPFFNEFVLEFETGYARIEDHLLSQGVVGGLALEPYDARLKECGLFCVTELHSKANIDRLASLVAEVAG